ncbi:MAG: hypothetical protein KDA21_10485 [Phycisphaerales bacterium]|nr:hypothetical protein [Phycisphaerales bacterium]
MIWRALRRSDLVWLGEKARRVHEAWLTRALQEPERWPRIPTRRVADGGFDGVMSSAEGRAWAHGWWDRTLVEADAE